MNNRREMTTLRRVSKNGESRGYEIETRFELTTNALRRLADAGFSVNVLRGDIAACTHSGLTILAPYEAAEEEKQIESASQVLEVTYNTHRRINEESFTQIVSPRHTLLHEEDHLTFIHLHEPTHHYALYLYWPRRQVVHDMLTLHGFLYNAQTYFPEDTSEQKELIDALRPSRFPR